MDSKFRLANKVLFNKLLKIVIGDKKKRFFFYKKKNYFSEYVHIHMLKAKAV